MKTKLLSLCLALICATHLLAYDCFVDGIYYNLNNADNTAEVTNETGELFPQSYSGVVVIPPTITYNAQTYSVTTIGEFAFFGCSGLTSVTIPNSVTTIGYDAFYGCSGLIYAVYNDNCFAYMPSSYQGAYTIPNGITQIAGGAFEGCGLTSVTIPNSVTTIGGGAFKSCGSLTSVTIPNSVTTIEGSAFFGCSGLTSVTIPNSVTTIEGSVFEGCSGLTTINIPNSVTTIGNRAFYRCSGLTSVTIPNSVTTIEGSAFFGCSGLTSVTIPNSVITIGRSAFDGCSGLPIIGNIRYADTYLVEVVDKSLSTYTIQDGTKWIEEKAFMDCSGLTSVTIPNSVTTIGKDAFNNCSGLTKTNYTGTIADWCKIKFGGFNANPMKYSHNFYINNVEIKDLVIPDGVYTIGDCAFEGCSGLTSVTIGNSVTTIGSSAFEGCSSLTSVTIPNSVTTIGMYAFRGCSSLTSITIGNSVTTIGEFAFDGCSGLTKTNYTGTIADWCKIQFFNGFDGCNNPMKYSHNFYINNVEIKDLVIPDGVDTIRNHTFYECSGLTSVTIPNSVTTIGKYAFYDCSGLTSVTIGNSVTTIGEWAFNGCSSLADIYCYAQIPPTCTNTNAFDGINEHCYIHVPVGTMRAYQFNNSWTRFYHFFEISEVPSGSTDQVSVEVTNNTAVFSWPVNPTASSYTLVIKKNDEVFCTLTFNSLGQLVGMAFAPRLGHNAPAATSTSYGYSFVVTGLTDNTIYAYTFSVKNENDDIIETKSGTFKTIGGTPTSIDKVHGSQPTPKGLMHKVLRNGQLLIETHNATYTPMGQKVK